MAIRFIVEVAWQAHFVKNMFIKPTAEELENFEPDFVVYNASKAKVENYKELGYMCIRDRSQSHRKKITAIDRKLFQTYTVPRFPDLLKKMQEMCIRDRLTSVRISLRSRLSADRRQTRRSSQVQRQPTRSSPECMTVRHFSPEPATTSGMVLRRHSESSILIKITS